VLLCDEGIADSGMLFPGDLAPKLEIKEVNNIAWLPSGLLDEVNVTTVRDSTIPLVSDAIPDLAEKETKELVILRLCVLKAIKVSVTVKRIQDKLADAPEVDNGKKIDSKDVGDMGDRPDAIVRFWLNDLVDVNMPALEIEPVIEDDILPGPNGVPKVEFAIDDGAVNILKLRRVFVTVFREG
jgi:hypothetical protein